MKKNITSDVMNNTIPKRNPAWAFRGCDPRRISLEISRPHHKITPTNKSPIIQ